MRDVIRYSESFKLQVVSDLESGRFQTHGEAREHYGITGCSTLKSWLIKYGKDHLISRKVRIEVLNEKDKLKELKLKVRRLEKALADTKVDEVLAKAYFEVLCEEKGIQDIAAYKKKLELKVSKRV